MQIHVVKRGDTLFSIAQTYRSSIHAITEANELETPNLVVGQALVIPIVGQYYFVQPGDSLYSISEKFDISMEELIRINQLPEHFLLPVGLRLYIPPRTRKTITTLGYIEPVGETVTEAIEQVAQKNSPFLTYLAPFSYRVHRDGTLAPPPIQNIVQIANNYQTKSAFVITNIEQGAFSSELAHIILNVQAVQNRLIDEIILLANEGGYRDVHFDFEFIPEGDRTKYNEFLLRVKPRLEQAGLYLSSALAPKISQAQEGLLYEAHDYKTHGELNDFVVIMTYEWGYSAEPPRPVSPINEVEKVLYYALTEIPPEKILMGQNLYGYDWTLPFVQGESFAKAISPQQAIQLAYRYHAAIEYDETQQAPYFEYRDENGQDHIVWFEDARSIQAKFNLIKRLNLLGIAYWKLGISFPQNWLLLNDQFIIRKFEE